MCGNVVCVLTSSLESLWSVVNLAITSEQQAVSEVQDGISVCKLVL
jgi:hypothetical protein